MKNKISVNNTVIEYGDALLDKIREANGKAKDAKVSDGEIISFLKESLKVAVNKGYGEVID